MVVDVERLPKNMTKEEIEDAIGELIEGGVLTGDKADEARTILEEKAEKDRIERIRTPRPEDRIEEHVVRTKEDLYKVLGGIHGFCAAGFMVTAFGGRMENVFHRIILDVDDDIKRMGMRYAFEAVFDSTGIRGVVVDAKKKGE